MITARYPCKINVVGTSGSGKSTFSRQLSEVLQITYIEMDALFWKANWQESTDPEFFAKLEQALAAKAWVLDGNYSRTTPIKWQRVDMVVWLNYSWSRNLYQSVKRALLRSLTQQELWAGTGNRESFRKSFFSKDSIILWMLKNYRHQQKNYAAIMHNPAYSHIQFYRVRSPKEARLLLQQLSVQPHKSRIPG